MTFDLHYYANSYIELFLSSNHIHPEEAIDGMRLKYMRYYLFVQVMILCPRFSYIVCTW